MIFFFVYTRIKFLSCWISDTILVHATPCCTHSMMYYQEQKLRWSGGLGKLPVHVA